MPRSLSAALASSVLALACGGHAISEGTAGAQPDAGVTAVQGSIDGISIGAASALAIPDNANTTSDPTNQYAKLALGIANKPIACGSPGIPNSTFIGFQLITQGTSPVGPGTYDINTNPTSSFDNIAALVTTDATCTETTPATCIGGSVTITSASATLIVGTFTLAFDSGEALTGSFAADVCSAIPPSLNGSAC